VTALFGWDNYVTRSGTTITAWSEEPTLPAANIANPYGSFSTGWQTLTGVVTNAGGARIQIAPVTTGLPWAVAGIFRTNLTPQASVSFALYSGGSQTLLQVMPGPAIGFGQVITVFPAGTTADALIISIDDSSNPDQSINVPLVYAGTAWTPATGPAWSSTLGRDDATDLVVTRGGQEIVNLLWQRRRWEIALDGVRASEVWADVDNLRMTARRGGNVIYVPNVDSGYVAQEAIFGLLHETADITFPYMQADRRAWRARVTERL
jgi:hypothetical protein